MASLPTAKEVGDALTTMLRRQVKATPTQAKPASIKMAGLYGSGSDRSAVAMCMSDLPFAAFSGAAFSMIPPDAAKDCIKANELDEFMQDNFGEVLNVLSRLFGEHDNKRIFLVNKFFPPNALPVDASQSLTTGVKKLDLEIEIDGYGKGVLAMRLM
jgi:hypothetical protein